MRYAYLQNISFQKNETAENITHSAPKQLLSSIRN